ncbi:MAG: hypothetical protein ABI042_18330 [Verrucomicrobiota bacterium]
MNIKDMSVEQLRRAATIKEEIVGLEKQLQTLWGGSKASNAVSAKGVMSAAGRARISAAAKARWAKIKASKRNAAKPASSGKKTMSAAARAKISAAAKARWAKIKSGKQG